MDTQHSPHLAEVSLKYKTEAPFEDMPLINSPQKAVEVLRSIWDEDTIELKEEFVVVLLNNAKRCLGWSRISSGGNSATIVDPAAIYQLALLTNAQSLVLAHNHTSGNLQASKGDITLTRRIVEAGKLLGIPLDDHIILTAEGHLSFKAAGLL